MSGPASIHDSLIERLCIHLKTGEYAPSVQRSYPPLAQQFLDYCDSRALAIETVRSSHLADFLRRQHRLFSKRHGRSPPFRIWCWRYTGAIHMLLRLVHGRWPVADPPAAALDIFHRDIVLEYDKWLRDLRGLHPKTRSGRTALALQFLTSLGPRFDQKGLAQLSVRHIDAYLKERCRGLRRTSIKEHAVRLRDFLRYLYRCGRTAADLSSAVIGPRVYEHENIPSALRAEEVRRVLEVTRKDLSPVGLRDYAILTLLATYGLRSAEIVSLRLEDIDWRRDVLRVRHAKTGMYSELPLLREPGEALLRYLEETRPRSAHREVFLGIRAPRRPFKRGSTLYSAIVVRLRAAGIAPQGRRGPHAFRHARAVSLLRSGVPLKIIGDVLGHRSAASTAVYLKLATEDLRAVCLELPRGVRS